MELFTSREEGNAARSWTEFASPAPTQFAKITNVKPSHLVIALLLGAIALSVMAHLRDMTFLLCLFLTGAVFLVVVKSFFQRPGD